MGGDKLPPIYKIMNIFNKKHFLRSRSLSDGYNKSYVYSICKSGSKSTIDSVFIIEIRQEDVYYKIKIRCSYSGMNNYSESMCKFDL